LRSDDCALDKIIDLGFYLWRQFPVVNSQKNFHVTQPFQNLVIADFEPRCQLLDRLIIPPMPRGARRHLLDRAVKPVVELVFQLSVQRSANTISGSV
jgi:hypothetical protein